VAHTKATTESSRPERGDNLFAPVPGAHGRFDDRAARRGDWLQVNLAPHRHGMRVPRRHSGRGCPWPFTLSLFGENIFTVRHRTKEAIGRGRCRPCG
jgi:hypothetical protein